MQYKEDIRSASSVTLFFSLASSSRIACCRIRPFLASRASLSISLTLWSTMARKLYRTSGRRVGSVEGVQEAVETSAMDETSLGWGVKEKSCPNEMTLG